MIKRRQPAILRHSHVQRLALEPRIVFDGALPVAGADAIDRGTDHAYVAPPLLAPLQRDAEQTKVSAPVASPEKVVDTGGNPAASHEIIFVDASVSGLQALLDKHQQAEVVILDPNRDGVEQIAAALAGRSGIDSIHPNFLSYPVAAAAGTGVWSTKARILSAM